MPTLTGSIVTLAVVAANIFCPPTAFAQEVPSKDAFKGLPTFNVVTYGADPSGVKDSAPAFRKAGGSDRIIFIPPGTYRFASTVKPPCCAYDPEAVLYSNMSNFLISGQGATLVADDSIAMSGLLRIDRSKNFSVQGLSFQGSRSGLSSKQENGAFGFSSVSNFRVSDIHIGKGFEENGDGIGGDWWVNGLIENVTMEDVGHCNDVAYLMHVTFDRIKCRGKGAGQSAGMTGISLIEDPPNQKENHTGFEFEDSTDVSVLNSDVSNFSTGAHVATGNHYTFQNNKWHDNLGSARVVGIGVFIRSNPSYRGPAPHDIQIKDSFENNGTAIKVDGQKVGSQKKYIENISVNSVFAKNKKKVSVSGEFVKDVTGTGI